MQRRRAQIAGLVASAAVAVAVTVALVAAPDAGDGSRPRVLGEAIQRPTTSTPPASTSTSEPRPAPSTTATTAAPVATTGAPPPTTAGPVYRLVTEHADNTYEVVVGAGGDQKNATSSTSTHPTDKLLVDISGGVDSWTFTLRLALTSKAAKAYRFPDGFDATVQVVRAGQVVRTLRLSDPSVGQLAPGGHLVRIGEVELPHQGGTYHARVSIPVLEPA